jgi:uncharacterized protein
LMIAPKNSENLGVSLENLVFNHLYKSDNRVTYLKDTYEVDFYSGNTLYQVSYDISDEKTRKRELSSFGYFKKESDICKLITHSTNEAVDGVDVISMDEFLIESSGG